MFWTPLTFIVWIKSIEFSFLGWIITWNLLCIYWIHHPCLTCSSVSYWGVIPLCTLMNFTVSEASGRSGVLRNKAIVHCPIAMSRWCPHIARLSCRLLLKSHVLVIHRYSVWQFVFVICLLLRPSPAGLKHWARCGSGSHLHTLSFLCVISTCMTTIELFKKCYQEKREKKQALFFSPHQIRNHSWQAKGKRRAVKSTAHGGRQQVLREPSKP